MDITRREFTKAAALIATGLTQLRGTSAWADKAAEDMHVHEMPPHWFGSEQITMVVYPDMTALDVIGPQYAFAGLIGATVRLVSKDGAPVKTDTGVTLVPDGDFSDSPDAPDILFVGGGTTGTLAAMQDDDTLEFLANRGAKADQVISVCTGSLILGAAGLLEGYKATTHWAALNHLADFGATPVAERLVIDRNRITGAGVSAGLDLGLKVAELRRDKLYAECLQLGMEYAPQPPFDAGTPASAPPEAFAVMESMYVGFRDGLKAIAKNREN